MKDVVFSGPADLAQSWQNFTRDYLEQHGDKPFVRRSLELLNELAFELPTKIPTTESKKYNAAEAFSALHDFIEQNKKGNLQRLIGDLYAAVNANAEGNVGNPLNKAIVASLMKFWCAVKVAKELPVLPTDGHYRERGEWARYQEEMATQEGSLLSGLVFAGTDAINRAQSRRLANKSMQKYGSNFDQLHLLACDSWQMAFCRYEDTYGTTFLAYLTKRLMLSLFNVFSRDNPVADSLNAPISDESGDERGELIADEKAVLPSEAASQSQHIEFMEAAIKAVLDEREETIIRKRFGMTPDQQRMTLDEIGEEMGVTRERIRQLEVKALEKIKQQLARLENTENEHVRARAEKKQGIVRDAPKAKPKVGTPPRFEKPSAIAASDKTGVTPNPRSDLPAEIPFIATALKDLFKEGNEHTSALPNTHAAEGSKEADEQTAPKKPAKPKATIDLDYGKMLAQRSAGEQIDLIGSRVLYKFARSLDELLDNRNAESRTIFGAKGEPLRESQQETLEGFSHALHAMHTRGYGMLPGGCGKTRIGAVATLAAARAGMRTLFVVPSVLAAESVCKELKANCPGVSVGSVYEGHEEFDKDVTVMVYNSLYRHFYKSIIAQEEGKEYPFNIRDYRLMVADEAHSYLSELAGHIFDNMDAIKLGLTATDKFYEGKEVIDRFKTQINHVTMQQAIDRKEIAKPRYRCIDTRVDLNLDEITDLGQRDELSSGDIARHVDKKPWNQVFVEVWKTDVDEEKGLPIAGEKTFIHCAGVKHAKSMAKAFNDEMMPLLKDPSSDFYKALVSKGIAPEQVEAIAAPLSSELTPNQRKELLTKYHERKVLALTSSKMLIESVDDPGTTVIMNATPTYSRIRAAQRGYRGSRIQPGKDVWYIYEGMPLNWKTSQVAPLLFAEAVEDQYLESDYAIAADKTKPPGANGKGKGEHQDAGGKSENTEGKLKDTPEEKPEIPENGYRVLWEYVDIAHVLGVLKKKRFHEQKTPAFDREWLMEQDNQRGLFLQALRVREDMSTAEAAAGLGISTSVLLDYEAGEKFGRGGKMKWGAKEFSSACRRVYPQMTDEEEKELLYYMIPSLKPGWRDPDGNTRGRFVEGLRLRKGVDLIVAAPELGLNAKALLTLETVPGTEDGSGRRQSGINVREFLKKAEAYYEMSPEEVQRLSVLMLPSFDREWIKKQDNGRGIFLRDLRLREGMTIETAAGQLGIAVKSLINYEGGQLFQNDGGGKKQGGVKDFINKVHATYHTSNEEDKLLKHLILPALDPERYEKIPQIERFGALLRAHRMHSGRTQQEMEEILGVSYNTLRQWERGYFAEQRKDIVSLKDLITRFTKAYDLTGEEAQQLLYARLPALDPQWLEQQPEEKRAGLFLHAHRYYDSGMTLEQAEKALGVSRIGWEDGTPIPFTKLPYSYEELAGRLRQHYHMTDADIQTLERLAFPALDEKWLETQPEHDRCKLFLAACRTKAYLTQPEVAAELKINPATIQMWENEAPPALLQNSQLKINLQKLMDMYKLSDPLRERLKRLVLPQLSSQWLDQQPPSKQAGLMVMGYRQVLEQPRETIGFGVGLGRDGLGPIENGERQMKADEFERIKGFMAKHSPSFYDEAEFTRRYEAGRLGFEAGASTDMGGAFPAADMPMAKPIGIAV